MAVKHRDARALPSPRAGRARPAATALPLLKAILSLRTARELAAFMDDLCTPTELEAIADRWRVVPLLLEATPYREIHDRTGVSVTTIGRIARCLAFGSGGYRLAAERILGPQPKRKSSGRS